MQFHPSMRHETRFRTVFITGAALLLLPTFLPAPSRARDAGAAPQGVRRVRFSDKQKQAGVAFEERVKNYVKLREQIEGRLPKLSKDSTPEQIEAHKKAFEDAVRAARAGAKPGDVFTADAANYVRAAIRSNFKGKRLRDLRKTILEAETEGVPVRVNYPYPAAIELAEIPAPLLLALPQLPKQVRYRFVGRHMLLVDRENGLIVDYMLNALP